jgi:hypothetical protein
MKTEEVLQAMAESPSLAQDVIDLLDYGMNDEWDCSLAYGIVHGFGGVEFQIAARTGLAYWKYLEEGTRDG